MTFSFFRSIGAGSGKPAALLRLSPLAVAVVIFSTAIPVELRAPSPPLFAASVLDFAGNMALYLPLGIALAHRRFRTALVMGLVMSTAIEVLQIWFVGRYAEVFDIIANVSGLSAGFWASRQVAPDRRRELALPPVGIGACLSCALGAAVLAVLWGDVRSRSDFSNWSPDYSLLVGNEATGDRPWRGRLDVLGIFAESSTTGEVRQLTALNDADLRAAISAIPGSYVAEAPLILDGGPAFRIPAAVSVELHAQARAQGTLTVVARAATVSTLQMGLPRLVSFSKDTVSRNFDLGQQGTRLWFRVRTPVSGRNGMDWNLFVETSPILADDRAVTIVATYDGAVARVFGNGRLVGRTNIASATCAIPTLCDSDLPLATAMFGALASVVPLGLRRPTTLTGVRTAVLACGFVAAVLVARTTTLASGLAPLAQLSALAGAAVVARSVVISETPESEPDAVEGRT
jgi:VanZ family protein